MEQNRIEEQAASTLLERGVKFKLEAPWPLRLIGKKKVGVTLKPLYYGTLLELSRLYAKMGYDPDDPTATPQTLLRNHAPMVCRIAAVCLLNRPCKIRWLAKPVGKWLLNATTPGQLLELMLYLTTYANYEAFTATIRLIGDMRTTAPKNLSQQTQGSQQS